MTREVEQTMQIAVCDDEKDVRELLADKIRSLFPSAELALYPSGEELLAADPAPDKKTRQMDWVRHMNALKAQAEEIVTAELINN